ncbi:c-type cytochrome biogenesis protein CcmI [Pseudomonadales bacterium]|nr:c-type cytochrome biogenesis protein CcmI [Pseudomonadales bacterium]
MFEFWFAAILMSAAVFGVAFAFIRASFNANNESQLEDNRVNDNLRLYQQRLSELDQLLALGDIDTQAHSSLVLEARAQLVVDLNSPLSLTADEDFEEWIKRRIQRRIQSQTEADNIQQSQRHNKTSSSADRRLLWAVSLLIPLLAFLIYLPQGLSVGGSLEWQVAERLASLNTANDARQRQQQLLSITQLLEQRVSPSRSKPELLQIQAEIYSALNQHNKAANVYAALLKRHQDNAQVTALLAQSLYLLDAESASAGTTAAALMSARVKELLASALRLDPQQYLALSMSGMQAFSEADYSKAIRHWRSALLAYGENSPQAASLNAGIQTAEARLTGQPNQSLTSENDSQTTAHIRLRVSIDPSQRLASDSPDTPVFVFARSVTGSRMPLAAKRLRLSDLPTEILLTENDKMAAQSIAGQSQLIVGARLARSGQPVAETGDSQSQEAITAVAAVADNAVVIELVINQRK